MTCSLDNIRKKTPLTAKKIGGALAAISAGVGTYAYVYDMPIYAHIGAVSLILSILIPTLFAEDEKSN